MKHELVYKVTRNRARARITTIINNSGSFTVEASLIIPGIVLIVFMMITANFILHDRITASALTAYETEEARMAVMYGRVPYPTGSAEIAGSAFESEDGMEDLCELVLMKRADMEKTLMFSSVMSKKAKVFGDYVTANLKLCPAVTKTIVPEGLGKTGSVHSSRTCGDYCLTARVTRTVFGTVKKVADSD